MPESVSFWTAIGLAVFAFAFGVRLCWLWMVEIRGRMNKNDEVDRAQQDQINTVLKKVNALMRGGNVQKITIKRGYKNLGVPSGESLKPREKKTK